MTMSPRRLAQQEVCAFVRSIIAERVDEPVELEGYPDVDERSDEAPDELWVSPSCTYVVEHTLVESFERQRENIAKLTKLLAPVRELVGGALPGYFSLSVEEKETTAARVRFEFAHAEVTRLILDAAIQMKAGETATLTSERLPFSMRLHLRHTHSSQLILVSEIEGEPAALKLARFRRAFSDKCPKLAKWSSADRTSVLVLESDDSYHINYQTAFDAIRAVLAEGVHRPDIVVYVETDAIPWGAYVFKDRDRLGNDAMRKRDGGYRYERPWPP